MSNFLIDTRELRSFRYKYYTNEINSKIKDKTTTIGICVTNSFYPVERQRWRENPISKDLTVTAIPNQIGRFFFKDKKNWNNVRNLFKGQIFLIKSKTNKDISLEILKQFLSLKKFFFKPCHIIYFLKLFLWKI